MLRWLTSLTDQRPLGSPSSAKKFVAGLDRDIFTAAEKISEQLRAFSVESDGVKNISPAALLQLEQSLAESTARLERDYIAASLQTHSLRERLWEAGYEWAMRFADAYRVVIESIDTAPDSKSAQPLARAAIGYFSFRAMAYRYRLYRHEEWIPGNWREINQLFKRVCALSLDHKQVLDEGQAQPSNPARTFVSLLLLRLGNAGAYLPSQTYLLAAKVSESCFDARLTARPASEGGFVVDLSGHDGFVPRHAVPQGGHFLFCDTSAIYGRLNAWLDVAQTQPVEGMMTQRASSTNPVAALRSALLRMDPEFKPLERASHRASDHGRLLAVYSLQRCASALMFEPTVLAPSLTGDAYGYADAQEIQTFGLLRESTMKRLKRDLPPEASRLALQYWHMRDRSDTGFRCVMPHSPDINVRLRDIVVVAEDRSDGPGWQVAMVVRLLKLPAGHIELGLQVLTREAESLELRTLRSQGVGRQDASPLSASQPFRAMRLKGAFFGRPIMGASWIMASSDYNAGATFEILSSNRRYEARTLISEGSDWVWVEPTEIVRAQ
jgi:hypothetical protein